MPRLPLSRSVFSRGALPLAVALLMTACANRSRAPAPAPRPAPESSAANAPGSSPGPAYGGRPAAGGYAWTPQMATTLSRLTAALRGTPVTVTRTQDDRIWLVLPGDLSFDANRSALRADVRPLLDQVAAVLRAHPAARVRIVGHTDDRGGTGGQDVLSLDRAASVRDWLVARGVPAPRFLVAGRAGRDPVASNADEAGRAKNRRVDLLIAEEGGR